MRLRTQTNKLVTQYAVNACALEKVRETEQFSLLTGASFAPIECRTISFMGYQTIGLTVVCEMDSTKVLVDHDWALFQELVRQWHSQRGTTSSPLDMAMCPAYQQMLAMGERAVPLILKQLELESDDPDHWFWALNFLTGEDPVQDEDRGNMRKMSAAWLRWGRNNLLVI
ncbi:hypothetical protein AB8Z38_03030 [Bradyrhizobium sp. LLZ17]|uniref:Uncharacterized protein n=1 Tax=Bradyrhizobium sp. LLZ17 TaxID=3239388 RepID=A0AB39XMW2_9BRAD